MPESKNPAIEYRPVDGFIGYEVGADGSVWSCLKKGPLKAGESRFTDKWRRLKPGLGRGEYLLVVLCRGEERVNRPVHQLVLEAFVGPRPDGMLARHFPDFGIHNCAVTNLRWGTPTQNAEDRDRDGNTAKGTTNGNSKLTEDAVREIRLATGRGCVLAMGRKYGISRVTVIKIRNREAWRHVL